MSTQKRSREIVPEDSTSVKKSKEQKVATGAANFQSAGSAGASTSSYFGVTSWFSSTATSPLPVKKESAPKASSSTAKVASLRSSPATSSAPPRSAAATAKPARAVKTQTSSSSRPVTSRTTLVPPKTLSLSTAAMNGAAKNSSPPRSSSSLLLVTGVLLLVLTNLVTAALWMDTRADYLQLLGRSASAEERFKVLQAQIHNWEVHAGHMQQRLASGAEQVEDLQQQLENAEEECVARLMELEEALQEDYDDDQFMDEDEAQYVKQEDEY